MCLRIKSHFIFCMLLLLSCLILSIAGLIIRQWVNFEDPSGEEYEGSLYAIDETSLSEGGTTYELEHYGWDCIAISDCEADSDTTGCQTFEPLMDAGMLYLKLEIAVIGLLLLWHVFFLYAVCFGREWGHPVLNYVLPHLAWIIQLAAVALWCTMSEVKFERGDCENEDLDGDE